MQDWPPWYGGKKTPDAASHHSHPSDSHGVEGAATQTQIPCVNVR